MTSDNHSPPAASGGTKRRRIARLVALIIAAFTGCMAAGMLLIGYLLSDAPGDELLQSLARISLVYSPIWLSGCSLALIGFLWLTPRPVSRAAKCSRLALMLLLLLAPVGVWWLLPSWRGPESAPGTAPREVLRPVDGSAGPPSGWTPDSGRNPAAEQQSTPQ